MKKPSLKFLSIIGTILAIIAGIVTHLNEIGDGLNKMYKSLKGQKQSANEKNSLDNITFAAEKELAQRSTKRNADWSKYRKDANDRWLIGQKVLAGPKAAHITVNLVPIPAEPTFTISQDVLPGLITRNGNPNFGGDSISVNVRSDAPGGVGLDSAHNKSGPLNVSGRDGGPIMLYFEPSWGKNTGIFQGHSFFDDITLVFRGRTYGIRAPSGINTEVNEDTGFWQKQSAPVHMRIRGPMSLEVFGIEPKELFSDTNPPDWYNPLPSKAEIIDWMNNSNRESFHSN